MTQVTVDDTALVTAIARAQRIRRATLRLGREAAIISTGWIVYTLGRYLAGGREELALENARRLWDWERSLGLPDEAVMQEWAMRVPHLIEAANAYYASVHFPLTIATLGWLFICRPAQYSRFRRSLLWLTSAALVVHSLFPLAPPRLVRWDGMTDTATALGMSVYGPVGTGIANQFAAMPSLHFGWSLLVAVAITRSLRSKWRLVIWVHPVVTFLVVVVTANHYVLDCAVAGSLAVVALRLADVDVLAHLRRSASSPLLGDPASPDGVT
ncbi:phosphatase PAP2 family protein [Angustibacter luteus]|uniref:Phosphatase PAP2 family protein n=1 Tax=Angustibacter luteus TaxID=658456 RepID=A0ABW1JCX0_9ACTN